MKKRARKVSQARKLKHFGKNTFCRFKIVGLWFRQISVEHFDKRLGAVSSVGRLADPDDLGFNPVIPEQLRNSRRVDPPPPIPAGPWSVGQRIEIGDDVFALRSVPGLSGPPP